MNTAAAPLLAASANAALPLRPQAANAPLAPAAALLDVTALRVELANGAAVVSDVSLSVTAGEILGLVGESGSGKSTVAAALLGHARAGAHIRGGQVRVGDVDLLALDAAALRRVRGPLVSHVAQDPAGSLNPLQRIGSHLHETLAVHEPRLSRSEREARIAAVLADVGLPSEHAFLQRFAHQLSGGQQQRVALALAFVLRPRLIVLDEPTTALDVSTQALVLATVRSLCRRHGVAAVYVSHDLAAVRLLADRVIVLYAGRIVEDAPLHDLFETPRHPYSQGLLAAVPDVAQRRALQPIAGQAPSPGHHAAGCAFAPRCPLQTAACQRQVPLLQTRAAGHRAACLRPDDGPAFAPGPDITASAAPRREPAAPRPLLWVQALSAGYGPRPVVHNVALAVPTGRCLAVVGESGSGKSTLARALAGLGHSVDGRLRYDGAPLPFAARARAITVRRELQYIFQNPYRSLNPRHTVGVTLSTAARHFFDLNNAEATQRAAAALAQMALPPALLQAYPRELSGGERQRVAIARALIGQPRLLICDEITSALDVSVQAAILERLQRLQQDGLALLFVTHDLAVVRAIADDVLVLHQGHVVEQGPADTVLTAPAHAYTRRLLADSPSLRRAAAATRGERC